jgi:hypothetical protein
MPKKRTRKPLRPHYSGDRSTKFWNRVNSIKDQRLWKRAYQAGCRLQNLEEKVLGLVNQCPEFGLNRFRD